MGPGFEFSNAHRDLMARDAEHVLGWRYHPRIVYRDESNLELDELLQDAIRDLIAHSDTFVAIQSSEYAKRAWCKWELKMAEKLPRSPRRRVVQLFLQDAPRGARNHADGRTRSKRAVSVEKMLEQESSGPVD